jgi:hypothetical protein
LTILINQNLLFKQQIVLASRRSLHLLKLNIKGRE